MRYRDLAEESNLHYQWHMHPLHKHRWLLAAVGALVIPALGTGCMSHHRELPTENGPAAYSSRLADWTKRRDAFLVEAEAAVQEATLLRHHPGWSEMTKIIQSRASIEYLEGVAEANRKTNVALAAWARKWEAPAGEMLGRYQSLATGCALLELERVALLDEAKPLISTLYFTLVNGATERGNYWALESVPGLVAGAEAKMTGPLKAYAVDSTGLLKHRSP